MVDLGYGESPVTAVELADRLREVRDDVDVVGLEIDPERVAVAQAAARPGLAFRRGGFELAGLRPLVVRALNVLRQYEEGPALEAWATLRAGLAPGGLLVEGTCDEIGRRAAWVALDADGPRTLTLAAHLPTLERPSDLAERLPKALIHHNVPGPAGARAAHRARRRLGPRGGVRAVRPAAALDGGVRRRWPGRRPVRCGTATAS